MRLPKDPDEWTGLHLDRAAHELAIAQRNYDSLNDPRTPRGDEMFRHVIEKEDQLQMIATVVQY